MPEEDDRNTAREEEMRTCHHGRGPDVGGGGLSADGDARLLAGGARLLDEQH